MKAKRSLELKTLRVTKLLKAFVASNSGMFTYMALHNKAKEDFRTPNALRRFGDMNF